MKVLLVGINAKFIQTNLAIRLLKAYLVSCGTAGNSEKVSVSCAEWNVNQSAQAILRGIYERKADIVLFSTYIWNRELVFRVAEALTSVAPQIVIGTGGPEVTYDPEKALEDCPALDFVISGEGELTLAHLIEKLSEQPQKEYKKYARGGPVKIPGITFRDGQNSYIRGGIRPLIDNLDAIPFPYGHKDDPLDPSFLIVYYESSRGCPFGCAYCLSSIERTVRFYSLERVFSDLDFFLTNKYPLVKFVDRTFNISPERYRAIWAYIRDNYNGSTRFHFEISAELLSNEDFELLETMPAGSIQFEIGIQSANPVTLEAVGRKTDLDRLARAVRQIPKSIHSHIDLIAGLPYEDLASFAKSFDFAFSLDADVIQLGFLKILSGTRMRAMALESDRYRWESQPPYEILESPALSFEDVCALKEIEHVVDNLWNTGLFRSTIQSLSSQEPSAFALMKAFSAHIRSWFPDGDPFLPRKPVDLFACMASYPPVKAQRTHRERLKFDFFMQAKAGRIPEWLVRAYSKERHDYALESSGFLDSVGGVRRIAYARSEYEEFSFAETGEVEAYLFKYPGPDSKSNGVQFEKVEYNSR